MIPTIFNYFYFSGRVESFMSLTSHHRVSHDENRVKIQVPSASVPVSWNTASGISGSSQTESSSSAPRGIVTILEGPQSCTTLVESLANEPTKVLLFDFNFLAQPSNAFI